ncbi:MAG: hypothetical protein AAGI72_22115 [Pseudomonadota bacterium]
MRVSHSLSLEFKLASRDTGAILTVGVPAIALTLSVLSGVRADQDETTALGTAAERVHEEWVFVPPETRIRQTATALWETNDSRDSPTSYY